MASGSLPIEAELLPSSDVDFLQFHKDLGLLAKELYQRKHRLESSELLAHATLNHQLQLCYYRLLKYNCNKGWTDSDASLAAAVESSGLDFFDVPDAFIQHKLCLCSDEEVRTLHLEKVEAAVGLFEPAANHSPTILLGQDLEDPGEFGLRGDPVDLGPQRYGYTDDEMDADTCQDCGDFCICGGEVKIFSCEVKKNHLGLEDLDDADCGLEYSVEHSLHLPVPVQPLLEDDEIGDDLPATTNSGPEKILQPIALVPVLLSHTYPDIRKKVQRRLVRRRFRGVVKRTDPHQHLVILDRSRNVVYRGRPTSAVAMFRDIERRDQETRSFQLRDVEELLAIYLWWQERYEDKAQIVSLFSAALANTPIDWDRLFLMTGSVRPS